MIILYVFTTLIIGVIVWLVIRRRWKSLIWLIGSLIVFVAAIWYFVIQPFFEASGATCEINREWKIENYRIVEKKCIGFAGPHYYPVYLYEENKEIDQHLYLEDSTCVVQFLSEKGDTLRFNICEWTLDRIK